MTSTFFAILLEAVGHILTMHGDRLSSNFLVYVELLLQSADDYRQVFLSHLHNTDVEHKYQWEDVLEYCIYSINMLINQPYKFSIVYFMLF